MNEDEHKKVWTELARPLWESRFRRFRKEADRLEENVEDWFQTDDGRRLGREAARLMREAARIEEEAASG